MKMDLHDTVRVPFYKRVSYLYIPTLFVITSVLLEMMMFSIMGFSFPKAYIFSLSIILIIASLVALIRKKWIQTVICSLLFAWQLTTSISNIIANDACMEIFSVETIKSIIMAFGNAGAVEIDYLFLVPIIALIIVYVVTTVLVMVFCRVPKTPKVKRSHFWQGIICGVMAFVSFFSYTVAYSGMSSYQRGKDYYIYNLSSNRFLYDTFSNRVASLRTFGSYSYYLDNFLKLLGVKANINDVLDVKVEETFQPNQQAVPADQTMGKGSNLIMVLMETFERSAINPVTMPNLYRFMKESCTEVDGYYSIERTCFTDHIGQTGMHEAGKELWNNYGHVEIPHSLANIFERAEGYDYQTMAFHDYDGRSYNRKNIFTSRLGFDEFVDFNGYETKRQTAHCGLNSDKDLFVQNMDRIAPADKNFYSYLISVSTHSLNSSWFNLGDYYPEYFERIENNWDTLKQIYPVLSSDDYHKVLTAKNYLAGTCNFDDGFGALLEHLRTTTDETDPLGRKLIETTAIVMFGDHYYYVNPQALEPETNLVSNPRDLTGNRSPLIVYNPNQKINGTTMTHGQNANKSSDERGEYGQTLRRFTSTMDLYPTVCSIFGIQTDQQLTYGHSIFGTEKSIGVGYLGGYTWGALDDDSEISAKDYWYNGKHYRDEKVLWKLWRTLDFVNFNGVALTKEQIDTVAPLVNRTYASIYLDTSLYDKNGFRNLNKSKAYHLPD